MWVEWRGSLSVLRGELSTLSLGMFGKCEWWSVLEPKCVCGWVEGFGGSSCIFVGTFFFDNLSCSGITVDYGFFLSTARKSTYLSEFHLSRNPWQVTAGQLPAVICILCCAPIWSVSPVHDLRDDSDCCCETSAVCSALWLIRLSLCRVLQVAVGVIRRIFMPCKSVFTPTADELPNYSVTTLIVVIVAPIIVLIILSAVAILVFRRIHHNQMERLTTRDAEYGTIDGLIASNVGESTLAVSSEYYVGVVLMRRVRTSPVLIRKTDITIGWWHVLLPPSKKVQS